jgi:hypothetical protein
MCVCVCVREREIRDSLVGIANGYWLDDRGFDSQYGQETCLYSITSRPALGPTQHRIQWVPEVLSRGKMARA